MTYRDWHSFQEALAAYNAAQARHEDDLQRWSAAVSAFDRKGGDHEPDTVERLASCALLGAGWVAYSHGVLITQWPWIFPLGFVIVAYQKLDKKCRDFHKNRFLAANPRPAEFTLEEPTFEPPAQSYAPPPRNDPPPPPPSTGKALTLDTALSILGLTRRSSLEDLKRSYRERMLDYHPDRVSHLGSELKELAERKAKEINAAYEYVQRAFQGRS